MKKIAVLICVAFVFTVLLGGCGPKYKKKVEEAERQERMPVNCATAEGDLRILEQEKVRTGEKIAAGVSAIAPIGLVVGVVTKTEKAKLQVATGEYNKMIDERIAQIKRECGIQ